jgi:DivIVA domain-containing protein
MEWRFGRTRWREGYAIADVDAFMERVRATLDGSATHPLTAHQIPEQRFSSVWLRVGYDVEEVDAALDDVEARLTAREAVRGAQDPVAVEAYVDRFMAARAESVVTAIVRRPDRERFEIARRGCPPDDVDALVRRFDVAVRGHVRMLPDELLDVRFPVLRRGYDREAVDEWCRRAAAVLARRQEESAPNRPGKGRFDADDRGI